METDLFGFPLASEPTRQRQTSRTPRKRTVSPEKLKAYLDTSDTLPLWDNLFQFLTEPLNITPDAELRHGDGGRAVVPVEADVAPQDDVEDVTPEIPYQAWGEPVVTDRHGLLWSDEGLEALRRRVWRESFEEMMLHNNEPEKWSVLKWIFRPAVWKYYVYQESAGSQSCLEIHEMDEPFGFYNCCLAVGVDPDEVRTMVRRKLPAELMKEIDRVCTF